MYILGGIHIVDKVRTQNLHVRKNKNCTFPEIFGRVLTEYKLFILGRVPSAHLEIVNVEFLSLEEDSITSKKGTSYLCGTRKKEHLWDIQCVFIMIYDTFL